MSSQPPSSRSGQLKLALRLRLILAAAIAIIYLVACFCPALIFDNYYPGNNAPQSTSSWWGWTALTLGWLGFFVGSVAWLANILFALALLFLLLGLRWATLICSVLALLLSLDLFPVFSAQIPADKRGVGRAVLRPPQIGVWLWFASIGASFVAAWILFLRPKMLPRDGSR